MSTKWKPTPLRDVLELDLDRVPVDPATTYPMVGVYSFGRGLFDREPVDGSSTSYRHFNRLKANHIVMSQLFGWEGALALSNSDFAGKFVSPQFPTFSVIEGSAIREFVGWYLMRPAVWAELSTRTRGMGDRRRTLNPDALFECEIPLPSISEQQRVAGVLERLARRVYCIRETKADIAREAEALLGSRFSEFIAGAPRKRMEDVAPLVRRKAEICESGQYPELGIRCFGKGTFHKPALDFLSVGSKKLYHIEPGDLLFSNVFAWEGAIAVASPEDAGRFGSHRFITCLPKHGVATADFLCFYFLTAEGLEAIGKASPGGAGRNRTLGLKKLAELMVPVPEFRKQLEFGGLLQRMRRMAQLRESSSLELDALKASILDRAFLGEL